MLLHDVSRSKQSRSSEREIGRVSICRRGHQHTEASQLTRGMQMSETKSSLEWRMLYAAAMLESDSAQLPLRIETADAAMQERLEELRRTSPVHSEKMELQSALGYLRRVRDLTSEDQNCL
jgi:hypothetical protein